MRPDGPYCASFHNEPTTKSPRPSSNSSLNVAHRKRSAEVKVIPVHHGYSQHTQSCRLLIGSKIRHVRNMGHVIGSLIRHVIQKARMCRICLNSEMGGTKQKQRCYFYISNRVVLDPAMKCVAYKQTNKTDHIYFAQLYLCCREYRSFTSSRSRFLRTFSNRFFMISTVAMEQLVHSTKGCYPIELKTFGYIEGAY